MLCILQYVIVVVVIIIVINLRPWAYCQLESQYKLCYNEEWQRRLRSVAVSKLALINTVPNYYLNG